MKPLAMAGPSHAWRQTLLLSAAALAVFLTLRRLPLASGGLHYTDFGAGGKSIMEFCEPGSPQFAPVDRVRSPVTLELRPVVPLRVGEPAQLVARLSAASGRPVTRDDLLVVHTERLHLLIVDASLEDYQHVHPQPTTVPGEFSFGFTPHRGGAYHVFADFTPRATGRALYAGARLEVAPPAGGVENGTVDVSLADAERDGYRFSLAPARTPVRTNELAALEFSVARADGGAVVLDDVMGAPAHLVAFDAGCTGFAHLHPGAPAGDARSAATPGDGARRLAFTLSLADPGLYRLWAQVRLGGRDVFVPFDLRVEP